MAYKVTHIPHNPNRTDEEEREHFDKMMYNKKSKSQALSNKKGKLKVHPIHKGEKKDEGYGTGNQFK